MSYKDSLKELEDVAERVKDILPDYATQTRGFLSYIHTKIDENSINDIDQLYKEIGVRLGITHSGNVDDLLRHIINTSESEAVHATNSKTHLSEKEMASSFMRKYVALARNKLIKLGIDASPNTILALETLNNG